MAASVNKVILIGNLGKDPEMRHMPSGDPIANVTIATSEVFKDRGGEKQERTEWHRVVFFGRLAEIVGQYLRKGSSIFVEGRLQTRKWQGQDGQDRYTTEIVATEMKMLGGRGSGDMVQDVGESSYQQLPERRPSSGGYAGGQDRRPAERSGGQSRGGPPDEFDDIHNDVPF